jgi:hypothetical protein
LRALRIRRPEVVPFEYQGKWLAWSRDMLHILEHGETLEDVEAKVSARGLTDVAFQYIPVTGYQPAHAEEGQAEAGSVPRAENDPVAGGADRDGP